MNSSKIKENKIIFLYAKTLQNLITEKDFSIDSSFSNFKCEKEIKKKDENSTILLLSSTFNNIKSKTYKIKLKKNFQSNSFTIYVVKRFMYKSNPLGPALLTTS